MLRHIDTQINTPAVIVNVTFIIDYGVQHIVSIPTLTTNFIYCPLGKIRKEHAADIVEQIVRMRQEPIRAIAAVNPLQPELWRISSVMQSRTGSTQSLFVRV